MEICLNAILDSAIQHHQTILVCHCELSHVAATLKQVYRPALRSPHPLSMSRRLLVPLEKEAGLNTLLIHKICLCAVGLCREA